MNPSRSYFLSTTPRTGSSLLAEALESTQVAGRPQEYFDPNYEADWLEKLGIRSDAEFFAKVLPAGTTSNGVFGAKVHWHQFEHLVGKLRVVHGEGPLLDLLARAFPDLRYVFLTRRDRIRQAVSYHRAIETNTWRTVAGDEAGGRDASRPPPRFDYERIDHWVTRLSEFEAYWRRHFERAGVRPLEVTYEELVEAHEPTVRSVLGYLELPCRRDIVDSPAPA